MEDDLFKPFNNPLHYERGWGAAKDKITMMKRVAMAVVAASSLLVASQAAEAKGCIKGAIVGGIAGHYAGHGVLGAVGGCAAGRALANRQARNRQVAQPSTGNGMARPSRGAGGYVGY